MNGRGNSRQWKLAVKIALACILAADGALAVVSWRAASEAPQSQAQERANLQEEVRLLAADVQKGREIEKRLPNMSQECYQFYQRDLLPAASGDTAVISDIGEIARKAGVQEAGALELREKLVKERGLEEVEISGSVQGNYQSLIQLIDGIERSPHFYLLEALTLSSEDSGVVKLQVALRTYFRT
jgi:Tfp pilus assembly protein PilO